MNLPRLRRKYYYIFNELLLQVTQETVAELSGVGLRTLKQFESGKGNPTLLTLQKLADVLGMEVSLTIKNITVNK